VSGAGLSAPDKDARLAELEAALATAHADITARDILIDTLRVQLARLKRMQFGKAPHLIFRHHIPPRSPSSCYKPKPSRVNHCHLPRVGIVQ
jgi:hypothetical protein